MIVGTQSASPLDYTQLNRPRRRVRRGRAIFAAENLFSKEKIGSLQILRPESGGFKQNLVGVAVAGEFTPPSTSLSKDFDKLNSAAQKEG